MTNRRCYWALNLQDLVLAVAYWVSTPYLPREEETNDAQGTLAVQLSHHVVARPRVRGKQEKQVMVSRMLSNDQPATPLTPAAPAPVAAA